MYRVIKPPGVALMIDMNRENNEANIDEAMSGYLEMKGFDRWFVKFSFKTFLKKALITCVNSRALSPIRCFRGMILYNRARDSWLYKLI